METVVIASNNKHKLSELEAFMEGISRELDTGICVKTLNDIGFHEEIKEDGETFEENSFIKANTIARLGYITVADDSGLCVDALNGEPGVYSARYAGEICDDGKNNQKLLSKLADVPAEKRTASFVSVITCVFPDGKVLCARGECPGTILYEYRGNGGFGYDPLFMYEEYGKTFAEMTSEEKNGISHRARAMEKFKTLFANEMKIRKGKI